MYVVIISYKNKKEDRVPFFSKYNAQNFMSEKRIDMANGTDNPKIDDMALGVEIDLKKYAKAGK